MQNSYLINTQRTRHAFLWTRILDTPFWAIFTLLPFILYKDLHASPFQVALIIALKPLSALLSMYWSMLIKNRPDRLRTNIIWGGILRHIPFFFFPFFDSPWFFIAAFGFQMMLSRGAQPAWMELLKQNIPDVKREKLFALGSSLGYIGDALLPFIIGPILDTYLEAWRYIFPAAALLSMLSIVMQVRLPVLNGPSVESKKSSKSQIKQH